MIWKSKKKGNLLSRFPNTKYPLILKIDHRVYLVLGSRDYNGSLLDLEMENDEKLMEHMDLHVKKSKPLVTLGA